MINKKTLLMTMLGMATAGAVEVKIADQSGTNPSVLLNSVSLANEYTALPSNDFLNTTTLRLTMLKEKKKNQSVTLNLPFSFTDFDGDHHGFGDLSAKLTSVGKLDENDAFLATSEFFYPTGQDTLGARKWTWALGVGFVHTFGDHFLISSGYVHHLSLFGDEDQPDVHRGDFNLYIAYTGAEKNWWVTSDFTVSLDYAHNQKTPISWELQYGLTLCKLGAASLNAYIKPGVGIGSDRLYDWNIEAGVSIVGF